MNVDYKKFYEYFMELYGDGLEILNWHLNGETEPLDSFIDSAQSAATETTPEPDAKTEDQR